MVQGMHDACDRSKHTALVTSAPPKITYHIILFPLAKAHCNFPSAPQQTTNNTSNNSAKVAKNNEPMPHSHQSQYQHQNKTHTRRAFVLLAQLSSSTTSPSTSLLPFFAPNTTPGTSSASSSPPVVVGGLVLDIQAQPSTSADVRHGGSVPGTIRQTSGGVGRNICEALARLVPTQPLLISVIGNDEAGRTLLSQWQSLGCVCCLVCCLLCVSPPPQAQCPPVVDVHTSTCPQKPPPLLCIYSLCIQPTFPPHTPSSLSTRGIVGIPTAATATVTTIFNRAGEVAAQIADTASLETSLTTSLVLGYRSDILRAPMLVLDGNLSIETLEVVCQVASSHTIPVWYEPVSVPKGPRIAKVCWGFAVVMMGGCCCDGGLLCVKQGCACIQMVRLAHMVSCFVNVYMQQCVYKTTQSQYTPQSLRHVTFISPNIDELLALADTVRLQQDLPILPHPDITPATPWTITLPALLPFLNILLETGLRYVVLTLGAQGAALACRHPTQHTTAVFHLDALPVNTVINTSGAGDCLVAATVAALIRGLDPVEALAHGVAAGHVAVQTPHNVPGVLEYGVLGGMAGKVMETLTAL